MSIKALSTVWESSQTKGSALLLMLAIADYCDDDGVCWPSVPTLARRARIKERNAWNILRKLEAAGELEITSRAGVVKTLSGVQRTNRYKVLLQGSAKSALPSPRGGAAITQGGAKNGQGGAIAVAPNPSVEPSVEPKEKDLASPDFDKMTPDEARTFMRSRLHRGVGSVPTVSPAEVARELRMVDGPSRHLAGVGHK